MTLGERIAEQRGRLGLSQSDLAERLEVSRQSVSKWETDASVPELDKLTRLCDLYGMTMDELVRGEEREEAVQPTGEEPALALSAPMRKLVGLGLLAIGLLLLPLILLMTASFPFALLMTLPLLACGVLFLGLKKPGLWCCWFLWLLVIFLQRPCTRFSLLAALRPVYYQSGLWFDIGVSALELLLAAGLVLWSVRRFRSRRK